MKRYPKRVMQTALRKGWIIAAMAGLLAGCVTNPGDTQNLRQRGGANRVLIKSKAESDANRAMGRRTVPVHTIYHTDYVALSDVAVAAGYHGAWLKDGRTYGMGDHDVTWTIRDGESRFTKAGKTIPMSAPAVRERGRLSVPVSALTKMFGHETVMSAGPYGIAFQPRATEGETGADGSSLTFSDALVTRQAGSSGNGELVDYAKKFLGVPYEFGAESHKAGGTFDCSSYVQHVYSRFGISLPRSSRQQATEGSPVSRDALLPGDLLFFHIPGRYKSQDTVGHVGMYIGDGQMIHASPAPQNGVQISEINNPYYLRNFLYAKRVLK